MTNEEAIKTIETAIAEMEWEYPMDYSVAFEKAIAALKKLDDIICVLDETDFHNAVSLNEDGEDWGYQESICEISVIADGKERWL